MNSSVSLLFVQIRKSSIVDHYMRYCLWVISIDLRSSLLISVSVEDSTWCSGNITDKIRCRTGISAVGRICLGR